MTKQRTILLAMACVSGLTLLISCGLSDSDPTTYTLTTTASPSEGGIITPSDGEFEDGEQITLRAEPNEGWQFVRWEGDLNMSSPEVSLTMDQNYTVVGSFEKREYPLNITIEGEGSVQEEVIQQKVADYEHGTLVRLTAVPDEGWLFDSWEGDVAGIDNPTILEIKEQKNITAIFKFDYSDIHDFGSVTDIDGNTYNTIAIGDQVWMAENLRVGRFRDGSVILTGLSTHEWQTTDNGAYVVYPHDRANGIDSSDEMVDAYGKLYNWHAVTDNRGLCPQGWRIPNEEDWRKLTENTGEVNSPIGNKLKSCRQVDSPLGGCSVDGHPRWSFHDTYYGTNKVGFSGLPGGRRFEYDLFSNLGTNGYWWSSTESHGWNGDGDDMEYGISFTLGNRSDGVTWLLFKKNSGISVRCLKK